MNYKNDDIDLGFVVNLHNNTQPHVRSEIEIIADRLNDTIVEKFVKNDVLVENISASYFESYSNLFSYIICSDNVKISSGSKTIFFDLASRIVESTGDYPIKLSGIVGSGKTTFLSVLYKYLYEQSKLTNYSFIPFYIDLHYLENQNFIEISTDYKKYAKEIINNCFKELNDLIKLIPDTTVIFIVDGTDSYFRSDLGCDSHVESLINSFSKKKKKIVSLSISSIEQKKRKRQFIPFMSGKPDIELELSQLSIVDKEKLNNFIQSYLNIHSEFNRFRDINIDVYLKIINKYALTEVDLNLITIISRNINYLTSKNCHIESIADLYYYICVQFLDGDIDRINIAAETAYNYVMTKKIFDERFVLNSKEWKLIQKHKSYCNYLIAYYVLTELKKVKFSEEEKNLEKFNQVYPKEINIFMKEMFTEDFDTEDNYIECIKVIYEQCTLLAKTHFCYLLGRVKNELTREKARLFLCEQLYMYEDIDELNLKNDELLLRRTISISLIFLGDGSESKNYINSLLENEVLSNINRGFHLEYYGDFKYTPSEKPFVHKDDNVSSFPKTFNALFNKINRYVEQIEKYNLFEIDIFTLCSLAQYRQINGTLSNMKLTKLSTLLRVALDRDVITLPNLQTYVQMICENLECSKYSSGSIFLKCDSLTIYNRAGWEKDAVINPESIAEHIYSCWLIGQLYLPNEKPNGDEYRDYSKQDILDTLLIHDIGESDHGDKISSLVTDNDKREEDLRVKNIFMHDTYPGVESQRRMKYLWRNWFNKSTINAQIAKDIDKIQAISKFYYYKNNGHSFTIEREMDWIKEKKFIQTDIGKMIMKIVIDSVYE